MAIDFDQLILAEAPGGVIVTTADGKVVRWTSGAERIFGYTSEETLGRDLRTLIALPGQEDDDLRMARTVVSTGSCDIELLRRRKDGALIYVDASSKAVYDEQGALAYIVSSKKDMSAA